MFAFFAGLCYNDKNLYFTGGIPLERLTPRQKMILDFIQDTVAKQGYPPLSGKLAKASGCALHPLSTPTWESLKKKGTSAGTPPSPGPLRSSLLPPPPPFLPRFRLQRRLLFLSWAGWLRVSQSWPRRISRITSMSRRTLSNRAPASSASGSKETA